VIPVTSGPSGLGAAATWWHRAAQILRDRPGPGMCLLAALAIAAYAPAMGGPFVFDDRLYVTGDERMTSAGGLGRIWTEVAGADYRHQYCPLTTSVFWLQHQLWGLNPAGYHAVNLLLHVANALLLWTLLRRFGVRWAWFAGAVFALHPVHVPSVAWIAELKNVLSGFFFLASMLAFGVAFDLFDRPAAGALAARPRALWYAGGLALLAAALLSKAAAALAPAALLAALWWRRGALSPRDLRMLAPPVLLAGAWVLGAAWLEGSHAAEGWAPDLPWPERLVIAGRALIFYAGKLLWPHPLSLVYPRWDAAAASWWSLAPLAVLAALLAAWRFRAFLGRAPLAVAAYFAAAVVPMSLARIGFHRYSFVADHWIYWASFGPIALAAGWAGTAAARSAAARTGLFAGAWAALALLGALTWQRAGLFASNVALWADAVGHSPASAEARYNFAVALQDEGRLEEAEAQYRSALAIDPADAMSRNNLGIVLRGRGADGLDEAIEQYEIAIRLEPRFVRAHVNLGEAIQAQGRLEEAMARYRTALGLDPRFPGAHFNLAVALRALDRPQEAITHYEAALAGRPDWPEAHLNLGEALQRLGRVDEAIVHYREALRLDAGFAAAAHNLALVQGRDP
jgi:tetratricopeptide (TPR) repeat protein